MTYGRFRSRDVPSFTEARQLARLVADDHIAKGDHTRQARRSACLGMMHERKQSAWKDHVRECAWGAEQEEAEMRETVASLTAKVEELTETVEGLRQDVAYQREHNGSLQARLDELGLAYSSLHGLVGKLKKKEDEREAEAEAERKLFGSILELYSKVQA